MGDDVTEPEKVQTSPSYSEIFHQVFPQYLMMGMSADEFWNGDSGLVKDYREAYRLTHEHRKRMMDESAWLQGLYIRDALQSVYLMVNGFVPKEVSAAEYPSVPRLQQEEEKRKQENKAKQEENTQMTAVAYMQIFVEKFNQNFRKREAEKQKKK